MQGNVELLAELLARWASELGDDQTVSGDDILEGVGFLALSEPVHELLQIAVGRRDHAHIDRDRLAAADPLEVLLLQDAEKLRLEPTVAVVGPSGAGKTSFLRAGLIPGAGPDWQILRFTPGGAPTQLARAVSKCWM